jgi:hypothetical protein
MIALSSLPACSGTPLNQPGLRRCPARLSAANSRLFGGEIQLRRTTG